MALDLIALSAAVPTIIQGIQTSVEKIREIKEGFGGKNARSKEEASATLAELQQQLQGVGTLAESAIEYSHTREDLAKLRSLCTRLDSYLTENADECRNRASTYFTLHWQFLRSIFDDLDEARGPSLEMINNRADWYDDRDRDQVEIHLSRFDEAFNEARGYLKTQSADGLLAQTEEMTKALHHADTVVKDTLYDTILKSLTRLGVA